MSKTMKTVTDLVQLVLGNAMSACAMACFALPYDMVVAGVTGVGRSANHFFGFGVTPTVYAINIGLFVIGWILLGKKFAATIVAGTFLFPFFLGLFQNIDALQHLVDDPLMAAICAGIMDGVGIGMVIRMGGSTGGVDVPPIILNRKFGWKVAPVMSALDVCIFYHPDSDDQHQRNYSGNLLYADLQCGFELHSGNEPGWRTDHDFQ